MTEVPWKRQVWRQTPVMPALGGLRQEDYRLITRVSYKIRPHLKRNKGKTINQTNEQTTTTTTEKPRGKIIGKLQGTSVG